MISKNNSVNSTPAKQAEEQTPLANLQLLLHFLGFDTFLLPVKQDNPVEQLMISSGKDEDEKGFMLQLLFANDMLQATNLNAIKPKEDDIFYLQFVGSYPLEVKEEKLLEMFLLMSTFNKLMAVGTFDYTDQGLFYRYTLTNRGKQLDNQMIVELVNMMQFFFEEFGRVLINFAQNDQKLPEAVEELEKSLGKAINPNR